jgi:NAD(P)-dependent dehydrogenase (short-subunit alcohol dehydrogenase family)
MGSSLVQLLHSLGAHVYFGDVAEQTGKSLAAELDAPGAAVNFLKIDTSNYAEVVHLFRTAHGHHGNIHHAIACAGILESVPLWSPDVTPDNIDVEPDVRPLEVNLKGTAYFARVALAYLNHKTTSTTEADKSLTLIASDMPSIGMPNSPLYQASKAGALQLMRVLRPLPPGTSRAAVRINALCPNVTVTPMVQGWLTETWAKEKLPLNSAEAVAKLIVAVSSQTDVVGPDGQRRQLHGMAFDITGGEAWETEGEYEQSVCAWSGPGAWAATLGIRDLFRRLGLPIWPN